MNSCADLSTESGEATCQSCLITNLPQECGEMSGASCFKCSVPVLQGLEACSGSNEDLVATIQCTKAMQSPSCQQCTCTVLCYESPDSEHCRSCLQQPTLATLFVHHELCQQEQIFYFGLCISLNSIEFYKFKHRIFIFLIRAGYGHRSLKSATKDSQLLSHGVKQQPRVRMEPLSSQNTRPTPASPRSSRPSAWQVRASTG